jgi:hypothetical protein
MRKNPTNLRYNDTNDTDVLIHSLKFCFQAAFCGKPGDGEKNTKNRKKD